MYMQRVTQPDEERWQHRILNNSNIVAVDGNSQNGLRLQIERNGNLAPHDFDAVILATGYARDAYEDFLAPARYLMPGGDAPNKQWEVERDYKVIFEKDAVSPDAGVFLQGCCEGTHGVSHTTLFRYASKAALLLHLLISGIACGFVTEHSCYPWW
jgi:L-ornithine N5-oxygenase